MTGIEKAISHLLTSSMNSPSETSCPLHYCPVCGSYIPRTEINLLGNIRYVQSRCQCEIDEMRNKMKQMEELTTNRMIERKFAISSLGERFERSRFDTFIPREGTEKTFEKAREYANAFETYGEESLLIYGEPGNGKSHLAAAVAHFLKEQRKTVVFQSVPELLERIKSTFNRDNKESEKEIMEALLQCNLLLLDDIGAEKVSDWVHDVLFRIIDGRYRQKKPVFYTSNLKPSQLLDQLGPRIYDRILETSIMIQNKGTSYRREKARERYKGDMA